ncbi:DUF3379 domain-containing protein [Glaciecola sp. MH2013]|uniref:DUF3379 family protein n=1 Tax=Glaciecola sp. MH2013 TaxID=2785524 RepID=UPI00189F10D4|nr:DUF3379 family protein [Glaciecola sp. MH2013]MBF7073274.1 DUF3379 domain-containing protein [Glaciecola sp. MH2013]
MDELTFRRTIYADPNTTDPDVVKAAKDDPSKQAFWDDIKALDAQMIAAASIPVPDNFAEKLILRQGMDEFSQHRKKRPWYVAMAASVAMVVSIGYMTLLAGDNGLANDVFAHVSHEYVNKEIMMSSGNVSTESINKKMATFNGQLSDEIGNIVSANYCYLDKIKSLHMIIKGEKGLISLFVVPDSESKDLKEDFSNDELTGNSFLLESAKIIVVGENAAEVSQLSKTAKVAFTF